MANTTFVNRVTPITAEWLQDVNDAVYEGLGPNDTETAAYYGAVGDGTTDDTTALQNAINANANGRLYIAPGTYIHTGLSINDNIRLYGAEPANTILKTKSGSNAHGITVAYTVVVNPIIENLTIDGNRTNNVTGHGIYLPAHAETNPAVTYGFAVTLVNSYVQNCAEKCVYVGANRNFGRLARSELKRGESGCYYSTGSSDWQSVDTAYAYPLSGCAIEIVSGAANVFVAGAAYGAIDAPAIRVTSSSSSPNMFVGMTINYNQMEAVHFIGHTGTGRHLANSLTACWFADNGLATNNTYAHIKLTDTTGVVINGNSFRWLGTGNRCSYLVEFAGASGVSHWGINSYDAAVNVTYGTAVTNNTANLNTTVNNLTATGTLTTAAILTSASATNLDVRAGLLRVLRGMYVASAVNYFDVYPSATGGAVRLVAGGPDTHIDMSLEPKGSEGCITIPTNGLRDYADDAAAATGGVPVRGLYHTSGTMKIRLV